MFKVQAVVAHACHGQRYWASPVPLSGTGIEPVLLAMFKFYSFANIPSIFSSSSSFSLSSLSCSFSFNINFIKLLFHLR